MDYKNNVLIIPDAFYGNKSGAIVAQIAKKLLIENKNKVAIFSTDIKKDSVEVDGTTMYHRTAYNGMANWLERKYITEFERILKESQITVVFTIGNIADKNICYLEIAKSHGIKVVSKIFMQDFFCTKIYAHNLDGPCIKCLDNNYFEAIKNKCIINKPIDYLKTFNAILIRKRLSVILPKIDYVVASTDEQVSFYQKYGIPREKCIKTPLYFDRNRLKRTNLNIGDYFVCIAQNRTEKGFHFLNNILSFCDNDIKIIAAYNNTEQAKAAVLENNFQEYINRGSLFVLDNLTWEDGLAELVAGSRGVIIPSIWPTTTEYGFLEALGYKKPVFCFNLGIHREKIVNGENGFVSNVGDCKTVALQLKMIKNDDKLFAKISENAEKLYHELTDWDTWKKDLQRMGL